MGHDRFLNGKPSQTPQSKLQVRDKSNCDFYYAAQWHRKGKPFLHAYECVLGFLPFFRD